MAIYIVVFLTSCLCLCIKEHTRGFLAAFFAFIGITLPCLLAAVRDKSIGTDVAVYGIYTYKGTKNVNLLEAFNHDTVNPRGFVALAWLINHVNGSFETYLFVIELLIILPAYLSMSYFLKKDAWFGMLFFYFLFYATSLNIMKQMIAVALSALALSLALKGYCKSWLVCSLVAFLFHQTGMVSFLVYPMYLLFTKASASSFVRRIVVYIFSFAFVIAIFAFSNYFLSFLSGAKDSYSYMIAHQDQGGVLITPLIYLGFIILLHFMSSTVCKTSRDSFQKNSEQDAPFIEYLSVFGLVLSELQIISLGLSRSGYYFEFYLSIFIVYKFKEKSSLLRAITIFFMAAIVILQIKSMLDGGNGVYPYTSSILGIK